MKKTLYITLIIVIILSMSLTGCKPNDEVKSTTSATIGEVQTPEPKDVITANITTLKGPTGMGMVRMLFEVNSFSDYMQVEFNIVSAPDVITAGLINGEIDIAAVPTNLAAVLYNKTDGEIVLLGVNTLGVLHIVTNNNETITSVEDLRGKTIVTSGQGSTPEYILNYILEENGLVPGTDVTIEYLGEHSEVAAYLKTGKADIVMLPEPFVTIATIGSDEFTQALDITKEWNKIAGDDSQLMMGCLVARKEIAENYNEEMMTLMMTNYESAEWVNDSPEDAAALIVQKEILPSEAIAINAIPTSNITFLFAQDIKDQLTNYYKILFASNPASVGGAIPGDDFYFGD